MIIPFRQKPHVVVDCRSVFETRYQTSAGNVTFHHKPPLQTFFVDFIDGDGFSCCVWDGQTYADALAVAKSWAREGVAVRDRTVGFARHA